MEYGLRPANLLKTILFVLILVVMEYGLRRLDFYLLTPMQVLILVVMEYGLRHHSNCNYTWADVS